MSADDTNFWMAVSTVGPVMFLAIGVLAVELARTGLGWTTTWQKVQLVAFNVSFFGTGVPTVTAVLSLAWHRNFLPPRLDAVAIVLAILAFWMALIAHFYDVDSPSRPVSK